MATNSWKGAMVSFAHSFVWPLPLVKAAEPMVSDENWHVQKMWLLQKLHTVPVRKYRLFLTIFLYYVVERLSYISHFFLMFLVWFHLIHLQISKQIENIYLLIVSILHYTRFYWKSLSKFVGSTGLFFIVYFCLFSDRIQIPWRVIEKSNDSYYLVTFKSCEFLTALFQKKKHSTFGRYTVI